MANKIDINKVFMGLENGSLVLELDLSDFDSQEDLEEYLQEFLNININYLFCIEDKVRVYPQGSSIEEIWERYEILNELDRELLYQYDKNMVLIKVWDSTMECLRNGYLHVSDCCNGKRKTCKGFIWSYTELS